MNTEVSKRGGRPRISTTTTAAIEAPRKVAAQQAAILPEFIRLPPSGSRDPRTGLCRASLNSLILGVGAPVRSVVLRRAGASRGIRLIHLESLLNYLHEEMAGQNESSPERTEVHHVEH